MIYQILTEAYFGKTKECLELESIIHDGRNIHKENNSTIDMKYVNLMNKHLKKMFNFKTVDFNVDGGYYPNAGTAIIVGGYNKELANTILKTSKGYKFKEPKNTFLVRVSYGLWANTDFTDQEVTAILLHETGHNFESLNDMMKRKNNKMAAPNSSKNREYMSDAFSTAYGYAGDLLDFFGKTGIISKDVKVGPILSAYVNLMDLMSLPFDLLFDPLMAHPTSPKRVKQMLNQLKKELKSGDLSKEAKKNIEEEIERMEENISKYYDHYGGPLKDPNYVRKIKNKIDMKNVPDIEDLVTEMMDGWIY